MSQKEDEHELMKPHSVSSPLLRELPPNSSSLSGDSISVASRRANTQARVARVILPVIILTSLGISAFFAIPPLRTMFAHSALRESGLNARGEIISVTETNSKINDRWVFDLRLRIHPAEAPAYEAHVSQPFSMLHAQNLRAGAGVSVKYDPENPQKVVVVATGSEPPGALNGETNPPENSANIDEAAPPQ